MAYFDVEITALEQYSGMEYFDYSGLKVKKINKTRAVAGTIINHVPLEDNYLMGFEVFKKQGGEYRKQPFRIPQQNACEYMIKDPYKMYKQWTLESDYPYPATCPIPIVSNII